MRTIDLGWKKIYLSKKQEEFFLAKERYVLYGGAKGGGKSFALRWKSILRRIKYPQSRGLILRRTYPELVRTHIEKIQREIPSHFYKYNQQQHFFTFPNGSILEMGACQYESDVLRYAGSEYDDIAIDEATEFTEYQFNILKTTLRTTRKDLKVRMFLASNPLGVGHGWVKRLFIDQKIPDYRFIPASVYDNPFLMEASPEYVEELKNLPQELKRAYLEGDWNIYAGQVFSEFRHNLHVIDSLPISLNDCKKIISFDWGYNAPGCALWLAFSPDKRVYVYREIYQNQRTPLEWAQDMNFYLQSEKVDYILLPHDCFSQHAGVESVAEVFRKNLLCPIKEAKTLSANARKNRLAITHQYLSLAADGLPYLQILSSCRNLIRTLPELVYDSSNFEDVDTSGEDHAYDALSIALLERQNIASGGIEIIRPTVHTPPLFWVVTPSGIQSFDFWEAFRKNISNRQSTTAVEFR